MRAVVLKGALLVAVLLAHLNAGRQLPEVVAFVPMYSTATIVLNGLTAYLLLLQAQTHRQYLHGLLASAYGFSAAMALGQLLSFPGVFGPDGVLGGGAQSTLWLWFAWHAGFPALAALAVLVSGMQLRLGLPAAVPFARPSSYWLAFGLAPAVLAAGTVAAANGLHDSLPPLIADGSYRQLSYGKAGTIVWGSNFVALAVLIMTDRARDRILAWVAMTLAVALADVSLTLLSEARYTVGWYSARVLSMLSASMLLAVLLAEMRAYYRMQHQLQQQHVELLDAFRRVHIELQTAGKRQRNLVQARTAQVDNLRVDWLLLPSLYVSGDDLGLVALTDDTVGFYNLDVAGHGVPSAMSSTVVTRLLSAHATDGILQHTDPDGTHCVHRPSQVARELNERFQQDEADPFHFTLVYGTLALDTGRGLFCQAGHNCPVIARADGRIERVGDSGFPIGLLEDVGYDDVEFRLAPGDWLFVYSDGVVECRNAAEEPYGEERLLALLDAVCRQPEANPLAALEQALIAWRRAPTGLRPFDDDISALAIRYEPRIRSDS